MWNSWILPWVTYQVVGLMVGWSCRYKFLIHFMDIIISYDLSVCSPEVTRPVMTVSDTWLMFTLIRSITPVNASPHLVYVLWRSTEGISPMITSMKSTHESLPFKHSGHGARATCHTTCTYRLFLHVNSTWTMFSIKVLYAVVGTANQKMLADLTLAELI